MYSSEQSLRELIDASPVGIMVTDQETGALVFNRKFTEVFGYDATDLTRVDDWWRRAYPDPAYRAQVQAALQTRIEESGDKDGELRRQESEVTCKDGTRRQIEFLPTLIGRRRITLCIDLTQSRRSEQALRESEERYRLLIENSNEMVVQVALDGTILYASPNHATITGRTAAELVGTSVFAHVHPDDLEEAVAKFRSSDARDLFRYQYKDGTWHWLESSGRSYRLSSGEERGVIVSRDVTDRVEGEDARKRLEAQLRQSQKMEAVGTLAGGIAHDFNNILAGLLGHLQLIEMDLPPGDSALRESLGEALAAGARARELVAQILAFSRQREQRRIDVSLGPLVHEAIRLLRSSLPATISIKTEVDPGSPQVLADPTQMHQVIMNLGANAGHAMRAKGGTLEVTLRPADPGPALLATHPHLRPGRAVRLTLRDTGVGMDAATLERIFEPFFTTKPVGEGTGLGLAIVHGILREHAAAIEVASEPGVGTTFHIYFPAIETGATAAPPAAPALPRGHGEQVMLVDDEVMVLSAAKPMMQRLGYRVAAFDRAALALAAFEKEPQAYDLVVTDLTMPDYTGVELISRMRTLRPNLPVIITTGYMRAADLESARTGGVRHFLSKPFTLSSLAEILQQAFCPAAK